MILIDFLHLPWLEINIYFVLSLCLFLIILKIIQYIGRWGNASVENIEYTLTSTLIDEKTIKFQVMRKKNPRIPLKKILIFTPIFVSIKRFNYFASALAQDDYEVILIQSTKILKQKLPIQSIIEYFDPFGLIGFDLISEAIISQNYLKSNKIKMIFIRPITNRTELNIFHQIPLTYRWFFLLFLKIHYSSLILPKFEFTSQNSLYIYPHKLLSSKIYYEIKKFKNNSVLKIQGGGFFFSKHETLVFGIILDFLQRI